MDENHRPAVSHWQLYHIKLYRVQPAWVGFKLTTLVVIGADCTDSCKSDYYAITTTMVLIVFVSVTCGRSMVFIHQLKWPPRYNWNCVESGVKHHNPNTNKNNNKANWCEVIPII
jgi:hypothetical protein